MAKDHKLSMLWVLCDTNKDHNQEYKMVDAGDCKTKDHIVMAMDQKGQQLWNYDQRPKCRGQ